MHSIKHSENTPEKQNTFRSASWKEKQLDYVVFDRRNGRYHTAACKEEKIKIDRKRQDKKKESSHHAYEKQVGKHRSNDERNGKRIRGILHRSILE